MKVKIKYSNEFKGREPKYEAEGGIECSLDKNGAVLIEGREWTSKIPQRCEFTGDIPDNSFMGIKTFTVELSVEEIQKIIESLIADGIIHFCIKSSKK